jgi:hypothetical protein
MYAALKDLMYTWVSAMTRKWTQTDYGSLSWYPKTTKEKRPRLALVLLNVRIEPCSQSDDNVRSHEQNALEPICDHVNADLVVV